MKKIVLSFVLSIALVETIEADIRSFANDAIVELESSGSGSTAERSIYYGGGFSLKAPQSTLNPINIQPPSVSAGCGGIDMTFGSISFLDEDQIVAFLQNTLAAAPGVAFDLALKTLCPSCSETLKALQAAVNQINQMGLDSCQAATALGQGAAKAFNLDAQDKQESGAASDWLNSMNETYLQPFNQTLDNIGSKMTANCSGSNCEYMKFFLNDSGSSHPPSLIENIVPNSSFHPAYMADVFRAMVGDIVVSRPVADTDDANVNIFLPYDVTNKTETTINNYANNTNTGRLIKRLLGENISAKVRDQNGGVNEASFSPGSLKDDFTDKLNGIIEKMRNREALDNNDIGFISMFQTPIYKIFNIYSSLPYGTEVLQVISEDLASYLAALYVQEYITTLNRQMFNYTEGIVSNESYIRDLGYKNVDNAITKSKSMVGEGREASNIAFLIATEYHKKAMNAQKENTELIRTAQEMREMVISKTAPDLYKNWVYSKTLGGR